MNAQTAPTTLAAVKATAAAPGVATVDKKAFEQMKPKEQIAYLLEQKKGELSKMLPKTLSIERLLKVATIAATTTPALLKCDIPSLVAAIGQCAQLGLEPNTVLGHAYLVPFNTKRKDAGGNERWVNSVQVIIGYKGLIELARRSGQIVSIAAHEVCQNDKFELAYGLDEKLNHMPNMGERGPVIGFYAVAKLKDGGYSFEFMSTHQVLQIRENSQGFQQAKKWNKEGAHPWTVHFVEMGRKTAIRRLAKYLPLSIEFSTAAALDEAHTLGHDQRLDSNVIDGVTGWLPDTNDIDDPQQGGGEPEAGTVMGQEAAAAAAGRQQADQQSPAIENKPSPVIAGKLDDWQPSEAEAQAIRQRERDEALGAERMTAPEQQEQPTPRNAAQRRTRSAGPSME
jgi:recombination protein RecT